jgi:hypothetical protein
MFESLRAESYRTPVCLEVDLEHPPLPDEVAARGGLEAALSDLVREIDGHLDTPPAPVPTAARGAVVSGSVAVEPASDPGRVDPGLSDPELLDDVALIDAIVEEERLSRVHAARRTALLAELRRRRPGDEPGIGAEDAPMVFPLSRWAPDEVGLALRMSRLTAKSALLEAARLETVLPATMEAFTRGRIDGYRAKIIHDSTLCLSDEHARAVEALVVPGAGEQTYAQLRAAVRAAIMRVDPDGANERLRKARDKRLVETYADEDGMAALRTLLPATEVEAIWQMLTRLAHSLDGPDDDRTLDQRRADLVSGLLRGEISLTDLGTRDEENAAAPRPGGGTLVQVVVGIDTLNGTSEQPGHLVGYGPIPADLAREAAADGVWRRLVTDPLSGILLDHGRDTYRPPKGLADFVRARDQVCRKPICRRRAIDAELDHRIRWADGGETSAANLAGFCKHDHVLKEQPGWQVLADPDGTLTWVTPTGHRYRSTPHDYRPHTSGAEPPAPRAPTDTADDSDPPPF